MQSIISYLHSKSTIHTATLVALLVLSLLTLLTATLEMFVLSLWHGIAWGIAISAVIYGFLIGGYCYFAGCF